LTTDPDQSHATPYRSLILSFYLPSLLLAFSQGLLIPVLPLYAKSLDVSYGLVGLISAGAGIGALVSDIPSGVLVRRLGHKGAMLLGVGCTALSTVAMFWATSVPQVVVCRLLTGFGQALYSVARHAYIAGAVRISGRGRAISLLGGLFRVGRFVGPMLGGTVAKAYGLRVPFLIVGTAYVAAFAVLAAFARAARGAPRAPAAAPSGGHLLSTVRSRLGVLASAGAGQFFAQMIRAGRTIIIPLYAADIIGLDVQAIGLILGFSSAVDMSLFVPAGLIMDRLGRKHAIVPSFVIQAIGMGLVPLTGSFVGLLLATTLIGLGNGLGAGSMMTLGADLAPQEGRGEFLGVWRLIGDAGTSGGPLVVGSVADSFALPTAALIMSAAGLMAGVTFFALVPETLKKYHRVAEPSSVGD
jgi:MFS family permease